MPGAFAKIAAASATGGGNNIRDGIYRQVVEKFFVSEGHTGTCVIAEFRVKEARANGAVDESGRPVVPNSVGSSCSMVCNITKHSAAAGNAKAFAQAAAQSLLGQSWPEFLANVGEDGKRLFPDEESALAWLAGADNPLRGAEVQNETYRGTNKGRDNPANAGKPLTLNRWRPVDMTEEQVNENRRWLDSSVASADVAASAPASAPAAAAPPAQAPAAPAPSTTPSPALAGILRRPR